MKFMKPKLSALEKEKRKLKRKLKEEGTDLEPKYDPIKAAALALKLEKKKKKKNKEREKERERKEIMKKEGGHLGGGEIVKKEGKENKHIKMKDLKIKMKKKKKKGGLILYSTE